MDVKLLLLYTIVLFASDCDTELQKVCARDRINTKENDIKKLGEDKKKQENKLDDYKKNKADLIITIAKTEKKIIKLMAIYSGYRYQTHLGESVNPKMIYIIRKIEKLKSEKIKYQKKKGGYSTLVNNTEKKILEIQEKMNVMSCELEKLNDESNKLDERTNKKTMP